MAALAAMARREMEAGERRAKSWISTPVACSAKLARGESPYRGAAIMKMDAQALIVMAVIGIVAGFLARLLVGGGGGLANYLLIGLIGSFVGGGVLGMLGINLGIRNALASQIVSSTIGAVIVVILARIIA
jgi:uncharacterized membrane protein YeaQ/YmgE (transglycosylase-associated protein family)